jgi:Fe-S-cluster-containing hydrogenase component 2
MKRKIIKISEELCNGCGQCASGCPEGAIKMINGKAKLVKEDYCDGLGACIGNCPVDAIIIEERETVEYDEIKVIENISKQGADTIKAHLKHLKEHNEIGYYNTAIKYLNENKIEIPNIEKDEPKKIHSLSGCPGSKVIDFVEKKDTGYNDDGKRKSELMQWPVQLHLVNPMANYFVKADVLFAADCVAFSVGDFHKDFLKGKRLLIACPKLDSNQESYKEKIKALIDEAKINTLTVMIMQVPCCQGLLHLVLQAMKETERKIPVKSIVISLEGQILRDEWVSI